MPAFSPQSRRRKSEQKISYRTGSYQLGCIFTGLDISGDKENGHCRFIGTGSLPVIRLGLGYWVGFQRTINGQNNFRKES